MGAARSRHIGEAHAPTLTPPRVAQARTGPPARVEGATTQHRCAGVLVLLQLLLVPSSSSSPTMSEAPRPPPTPHQTTQLLSDTMPACSAGRRSHAAPRARPAARGRIRRRAYLSAPAPHAPCVRGAARIPAPPSPLTRRLGGIAFLCCTEGNERGDGTRSGAPQRPRSTRAAAAAAAA